MGVTQTNLGCHGKDSTLVHGANQTHHGAPHVFLFEMNALSTFFFFNPEVTHHSCFFPIKKSLFVCQVVAILASF